VKLRNAVHDSLIATAPGHMAREVCQIMKETMELCQSWIVPTVAEAEVGPTWAEMIDLDKLGQYANMVDAGLTDQDIAHLMELCKPEDYTDETCTPLREVCQSIGLLEE
jgi:hypothetical protein